MQRRNLIAQTEKEWLSSVGSWSHAMYGVFNASAGGYSIARLPTVCQWVCV